MFHVRVYPVSVLPHHIGHTMPLLSVCVHVRAWQQHIWLPSGPWNCSTDLEVLRCLFIARSLGAWPYSLWHFQALICRCIVMECLFCVTLCSCHTIFYLAQRSSNPVVVTLGCNLALIQSVAIGGCCHVVDMFYDVNRIDWMVLSNLKLLFILALF